AATAECIQMAREPGEILAACEMLLRTTRELLLGEQRHYQRGAASFPAVFHAAYPELKADLQHILLACERQAAYGLSVVSLYHELMIHMAQAFTGIQYS